MLIKNISLTIYKRIMSFSNNLQSNNLQSNINISQTKQEIQTAIENLIDTKLEQKLIDSNFINSPVSNSPMSNSPMSNSPMSNIHMSNSPMSNSPVSNNSNNNHMTNCPISNSLINNNIINRKNNIIKNSKNINLSQKNNKLIHLDTLFQKNNFKNKNLILTNIDLDTDNVKLLIRKYRNDYLEQRLYFDNNFKESAKWSDTPENDSCINDVFSFVNVIQNKVEFFRIENILQNYINVKTKDKYELSKDFKLRRTLILSKKIMETPWNLLKEYLDYSYNFTFRGMIKCYRKI